jgi:hypothetical protein
MMSRDMREKDVHPFRNRLSQRVKILWWDGDGYLQADAYDGYDGIYVKGDVVEVACWAHARRKFIDAKETEGRRAAEMLEFARRL